MSKSISFNWTKESALPSKQSVCDSCFEGSAENNRFSDMFLCEIHALFVIKNVYLLNEGITAGLSNAYLAMSAPSKVEVPSQNMLQTEPETAAR